MTPDTLTKAPAWEPLSLAPIVSAEGYLHVAEHLKRIKAFQKRVVEFFAPHKANALNAHRALLKDEQAALAPAAADEEACKRLLIAWDTKQDQIRREAEAQLREQARIADEDRRLREAAALEQEAVATGDSSLLEHAQAILDTPLNTAALTVEKATPKVTGLSYREEWKWRVTNANEIPREYLMLDEVKINKVVRAMKGMTKIKGIVAYSTKGLAAGNR